MAAFYADSSALVKVHIREQGTTWLRSLIAVDSGHTVTTSRLAAVEVISAFNRRVREGTLNMSDYALTVRGFQGLYRTRYGHIGYTNSIIRGARHLLEQHPLRAYDAVHLASALEANTALLAAQQPPLIFLAADVRLITAAQAEGLPTDDPNMH